MGTTFLLGGAQTDFVRNWTREGATLAQLMAEPVRGALQDAHIDATAVQVGHVGNFASEIFCGQGHLGGLLGAMTTHRESVGALGVAVDHFVKVSRSYWPGLFACYDTPGRPRTNNDLEQAFGSHRYHERRATGRKGASPALVLRGAAKLVAGLATRHREVTAEELAGADRGAWKRPRSELEARRERRVERRRFRRDHDGYLNALENKLIQSRLPT